MKPPDEITFKINQQWDQTRINSEINNVGVVGAKFDIDQPTNIEIRNEPFLQEILNITGQTIKNIPANFQASPSTDSEGNEFLSTKYIQICLLKTGRDGREAANFYQC